MRRTSVTWLIISALVVAVASGIVTWGLYGSLLRVSVAASLVMWVMAAVCVVLGHWVRTHLEEGSIGLDRSQLNPITVSVWLVAGRASAWTGALLGGMYAGMASFVVPKANVLAAAQADLPGVVVSCGAAVCLAAAGVYLERSCQVPPSGDSDQPTTMSPC